MGKLWKRVKKYFSKSPKKNSSILNSSGLLPVPDNNNVALCPICFEILLPPIYLCVNGHSVCESCKCRITSCPLCKLAMSETRNYAMEDLINNSNFACDNEGCQEVIKGADMKDHMTNCSFKTIDASAPASRVGREAADQLEHIVDNFRTTTRGHRRHREHLPSAPPLESTSSSQLSNNANNNPGMMVEILREILAKYPGIVLTRNILVRLLDESPGIRLTRNIILAILTKRLLERVLAYI